MQESHTCLFYLSAAFAVITGRAGSYDITPNMGTTHMPGNYMVDGEVWHLPAAILTGEPIPPKDFPSGQPDSWSGAANHFMKPDHGRSGKSGGRCPHCSTPIEHEHGFLRQHQAQRPVHIADIDGFKIGI
jgi:hypothetical protein